jgi:hypothetical protein
MAVKNTVITELKRQKPKSYGVEVKFHTILTSANAYEKEIVGTANKKL